MKVTCTSTEKFLLSCTAPAIQAADEVLIIWGCITWESPEELYIIDGSVNNQIYVQILEEVTVLSVIG